MTRTGLRDTAERGGGGNLRLAAADSIALPASIPCDCSRRVPRANASAHEGQERAYWSKGVARSPANPCAQLPV
eukprot:4687634-Lingulodinium_polyedra.AAC.1